MSSLFSGKSGRLVFWLGIVFSSAGLGFYYWQAFLNIWWGVWWWHLLHLLVTVLLFIVALSVIVRRLRDLGQSPWWAVLALLPPLWILFLLPLGFFRRPVAASDQMSQSSAVRHRDLEDDYKTFEDTADDMLDVPDMQTDNQG